MDKLGVDRRLYTSGAHKAFLDPFSPENPAEVQFWKTVLDDTHRQFINEVKRGRGDRLKDVDGLFSGLVWTGQQAQQIGLVDGLGSVHSVARDVIGAEDLVDYGYQPSPLQQLVQRFGASFGKAVSSEFLHAQMSLQ